MVKNLKNHRFLIGLDIGGTKLMAVVLDEHLSKEFKPLGRFRMKTRGKKGAAGGGALFDRIVECVLSAMGEAGVAPAGLRGIGVGSPGPLDPDTGVIIDTPNIGWKNFPLGKKLSAQFKVPVAVDNDVNLGVYGEFHFGAARGGRYVFGVFPGTGIGGGIVLEGKIYHGASGAAGEIGHVVMDPAGPLCGCGNHGCLESFAGRLPIAGQLAALALRGQARELAEEAGSDPRDIRSSQIADAVEAGDGAVEQVMRREAERIGLAVAGVVNVLSPDTVVLGGGLVEAMPKLFVEEVSRAIKKYALPFLAKFVKVVVTELGDDAVAMGAAKLIAERLGEKNSTAERQRRQRKTEK